MSSEEKQIPKEERKMIRIPVESEIGKVRITEEVLVLMAGIAATEVEGVASINRTATRQLVSKLGMKSLAGGVEMTENEGVLTFSLNLNFDFGVNVGEASTKVQEKVKSSIENTTGLKVEAVNVSVAGVDLSDKKVKS